MTIKPIEEYDKGKIKIDLTAPEGNAFWLLATAGQLAKQLMLDSDAILAEMKLSDYEHLLEVFEKHFGDYVDLYR
jgi:hypothetical protein